MTAQLSNTHMSSGCGSLLRWPAILSFLKSKAQPLWAMSRGVLPGLVWRRTQAHSSRSICLQAVCRVKGVAAGQVQLPGRCAPFARQPWIPDLLVGDVVGADGTRRRLHTTPPAVLTSPCVRCRQDGYSAQPGHLPCSP